MKIKIKGFIINKKSELYSDCADNYAINREHNKFAISDGVSKSFFPKVWSDILVKKYVEQKDWKDEEFIIGCQKEWQSKIDEIVSQPETKWFTKSQYNRKDPALATFIGLQFIESEQKWIAQAIGDSFLFFIPKDSNKIEIKLSSKPDSEPIVFDNFPDYLSSIGNSHKGEKKLNSGNKIENGTFYLMTDALAEWFLQNTEQAIQKLKNIQNQEQFLVTIEDERNANRLNDDDSAVLIIDVIDDEKKEFTYSNTEVTLLSELVKEEAEKLEESKKKETFLQESSSNSNIEENITELVLQKDETSVNETTEEIVEQSTEIVKSGDTISETNNEKETKSNGTDNLKEESTNNSSKISDEKQEEKLPDQTPNKTSDNPKTKSIFDKF